MRSLPVMRETLSVGFAKAIKTKEETIVIMQLLMSIIMNSYSTTTETALDMIGRQMLNTKNIINNSCHDTITYMIAKMMNTLTKFVLTFLQLFQRP